MGSFYREQLEVYLNTLDITCDRLLDIGGSAYPVRHRLHSLECKKYDILDNGNEQEYHEKWTKPDIVMDINKEYKAEYENTYDVIFCLEVAEYLYNPLFALTAMCKYLKKEGELYMSFPFVYPFHQPIQSDYLRYTQAGVMKLLMEAGFKTDDIGIICRIDRTAILEEFYRADGMRGAKGHRHDVTGYIIVAKK